MKKPSEPQDGKPRIVPLQKNTNSMFGMEVIKNSELAHQFLLGQPASLLNSLFGGVKVPLFEGDQHELDLVLDWFVSIYSNKPAEVGLECLESWLCCFLKHHALHLQEYCKEQLLSLRDCRSTVLKNFQGDLSTVQSLLESYLGILVV
ncbi:hypothetical protein GEMRC1_011000 [Eukaryota sp. GEM-RC1]